MSRQPEAEVGAADGFRRNAEGGGTIEERPGWTSERGFHIVREMFQQRKK
jgi:hypothetical protein